MARQTRQPHIFKLLQEVGSQKNPSELFLVVLNLSSSNSLQVIGFNESYRHDCQVQEVINDTLVVVKIPELLKQFQIMITCEVNKATLESNIVEFTKPDFQYLVPMVKDINIAIKHLKNLTKLFQNDGVNFSKAMETLLRNYQSSYEAGNSVFHDAIWCGKFSEIAISFKNLPKKFLTILENNFGENLLHYAARLDRYEDIKILLALDLYPLHKQNSNKSTFLHLAIECAANETLKLLAFMLGELNENSNFKSQMEKALKIYNSKGQTPLHLAILYNQQALVKAVIRYCKIINKLDICRMEVLGAGESLLHLAKSKNLNEMWKLIVAELPEAKFYTNYAGQTSEEEQLKESVRKKRSHLTKLSRHSYKKHGQGFEATKR